MEHVGLEGIRSLDRANIINHIRSKLWTWEVLFKWLEGIIRTTEQNIPDSSWSAVRFRHVIFPSEELQRTFAVVDYGVKVEITVSMVCIEDDFVW